MLEFYPLPTNLSHGASLYGQQQNLGGARFLDNPANIVTTQNHNNNNNINHITACCSLTVPVTISQQQQQQQQQMIASPNQAACPPQQNNVTSVSTCLTAALTAQTTLHAHHTQHQNAISAASSGCVGVGVDSLVTNINPLINSNTHNNSNSNRNCSTPLPLTINSSCTSALNLSAILGNANNNTNNIINTTMNSSNLSQNNNSNNNNNNNNNHNNNNSKNNLLNTCPVNNKLTIPTITITTAGTTKATAPPPPPPPLTTATTTTTITTTATSPLTLTTSILSSTKLVTECNGRTEVIDQIKCEKNCEVCEGCGHKIHDRYLMNVGDTNWHENCLACCFCGLQLYQTCYVRNGKLYCKMDYDRLFGYKCAACCHTVFPHDMVMRPLANLIFHLPCFVCVACRLPLLKGEQFMLREGQILCFRHDLEKELYFAAAHQCNYLGLDEDDMMMRPRDGRRGPKRPRTILTSQQRKQFKLSFEQSPKPCRKVREALAKDTGLSVRVVQVWFQNQRAKMKKIQRKAKNNNNNNNNLENKDQGKEGNKNENNDSLGGGSRGEHTENSYLGLDNNYATRPLNPNVPFSPDDYQNNSNDSFCSSDLSLDGSNFDHLDDDADSLSLNNLELQSTGSSGHHHNHHHHSHHHHSTPHDILANLNSNLTNPIDKLYLMQNSYFQGDS